MVTLCWLYDKGKRCPRSISPDEFKECGVRRIAEVAFQVNENTENIGARRLHTVMERLLEVVSFEASEKSGSKCLIDAEYVNAHLEELLQDEDLSRFIL